MREMGSQVFYRKWRPQTLSDVVGQEQATRTLHNALNKGQISHAYLFCGPRGTGKTSTGRILAKAVNCLNNDGKGEPCNSCAMCQAVTDGAALDVIEVDAASNRGIDEIRDLREKVTYSPNQARYKVYIIDEVHMLTKEASNALLKTLEEPPPHAIFILATTESHKILPTILSRCQRFDFRRISQADVVAKLESISRTEDIRIEPEALRLIARATTGSLRDAENLLQQLTIYYGSDVELPQVQKLLGITGDWRARDLVKHIVNNDVSAGVATVNGVNNDGLDLRQFNRELVEYLRALLLLKSGAEGAIDLPVEDVAELKKLAKKSSLPRIIQAVKLFGQLEAGLDGYSTLPLELALVDCSLEPGTEKSAPEKAEDTGPPPPETGKPAAGRDQRRDETELDTAKTAGPESAPKKPAEKKQSAVPEVPQNPAPGGAKTPEGNPASLSALSSEIEQLRKHWRQVITDAPPEISRTPAAALLRSARPSVLEGNTLVLSFRYPLHKENMEKPDNQQTAEKIISSFLGRACRLRCVHEPEANHLVEEALKIGAQLMDGEEQ